MASTATIRKTSRTRKPVTRQEVEYTGRHAKTGNSSGFRFEAALFKSHPEFSGRVTARVVAPGQLLVMAEPQQEEEHDDPVLAAFLDLLARDMEAHPEKIKPLDGAQMERITELVKGVKVNLDEDLGDEDLLA
jgi:hypothetical protein